MNHFSRLGQRLPCAHLILDHRPLFAENIRRGEQPDGYQFQAYRFAR